MKMLFNTWLNKQSWAWTEDYEPELNWKAGASNRPAQTISASKIAGKNSLLSRFSKDLQNLYANGYTRIATNKDGQQMVSFSNAAFNVSASDNGGTLVSNSIRQLLQQLQEVVCSKHGFRRRS